MNVETTSLVYSYLAVNLKSFKISNLEILILNLKFSFKNHSCNVTENIQRLFRSTTIIKLLQFTTTIIVLFHFSDLRGGHVKIIPPPFTVIVRETKKKVKVIVVGTFIFNAHIRQDN